MQLLCTLRNRCRQQPRNTRYQAGATPYLSRTFTGWTAPASAGALIHIPSQYVRDYERLLMGGVWAQLDMRFESDEETKGKNPFWIDKLVPIQIATFDLDEYRNVRKRFATDEWIDLMVRSMGYEPSEMAR